MIDDHGAQVRADRAADWYPVLAKNLQRSMFTDVQVTLYGAADNGGLPVKLESGCAD